MFHALKCVWSSKSAGHGMLRTSQQVCCTNHHRNIVGPPHGPASRAHLRWHNSILSLARVKLNLPDRQCHCRFCGAGGAPARPSGFPLTEVQRPGSDGELNHVMAQLFL